MSDSFGEAAARLCGGASLLLGWRPAEFWSSTPAELAVAFQWANVAGDGPERELIEDMRRRFPDN